MHNKHIQLEELNCSICQEKFGYNNSSSPRILSCGHTFCTRCLKSVIKEQPLCPDCRVQIKETNIEKIPIVYIIKQIIESIKSFNELQDKITPLDDCNAFESKCTTNLIDNPESLPSVGTCILHKAPQQFYCQYCKFWICGTCAYINHSNKNGAISSSLTNKDKNGLSKSFSKELSIKQNNITNDKINKNGKCKVVQAAVHFEILKSDQLKLLDEYLQELNLLINTAESFDKLVKEEIKNNTETMDKTDSILNLYSEISTNVHEKISELQESLKIFNEFKKKLNVKSLNELYIISKNIECLIEKYLNPHLESGIFTIIINKAPQLLMKVNGIITSLRRGDKYVYSHIRFEDEYIMMASLKEGPMDGDYIVPFQEIKRKSKHMKTFLRLGRQGRKLGTLEIQVFNNRRSEQFVMLCTGEKGPSYKWTKFFASGGLFTQYVAGGDYEKNDGTGGSQIIDDVGDPYGIMMQDGIICGEISFNKNQLGQFKIFYKVGSSPFAHCPIGLVVKGLPLVTEFAQKDCTKVYVEECGILIPIKD